MADTNKTYGIRRSYRPRNRSVHYDDTGQEDEWQLEVYLHAQKMMRDNAFRSVIDIGCGSAYKLIRYLGEYETLGLEVSPTYEHLLEHYPDRRWMRSDFSLRGGLSADVVICADVIEHLVEPDELLAFIHRIESRYVVLSTPSRDLLYSFWNRGYWGPPRNVHHIREWSFSEFRDYISGSFDIALQTITNREQATQMVVCRQRRGGDLRLARGAIPPGR
jgi:SAM-dependent methyltransferase